MDTGHAAAMGRRLESAREAGGHGCPVRLAPDRREQRQRSGDPVCVTGVVDYLLRDQRIDFASRWDIPAGPAPEQRLPLRPIVATACAVIPQRATPSLLIRSRTDVCRSVRRSEITPRRTPF